MKLLKSSLILALVLLPLARADEETAPTTEGVQDAATAEPAAPEAPAKEEEAKPVLPLQLHCGQLLKITPAPSVEMVDFDKMLAEGKLEVNPNELSSTDTKEAGSGNVFAVAEIRLSDKKTVGKTDFALRYGSESVPCLALAEGVGGFDVRRWRVQKGTVRLLFEVPDFTNAVALEYAAQLRVKLPPSPEIPFGEQPDEPAPAVAAPAVSAPAPAVPSASAKEEKPEPPKPAKEEKPAPKPEPKKPEPKPEPKKDKPADEGIPLF